MGVKIAIDDFGTGYSSLSYLRRLPFDKLKLDQSFTRDAVACEQDAAITRAIVAMAHGLELTVVAEGVETVAQLDFLMGLGCTIMQGYLLGRPQPGSALTEILRAAQRPGGSPRLPAVAPANIVVPRLQASPAPELRAG
jgi:EAL domain-containing protein (putative c-di-GMP-specific phosphodiesterase class I)